MTDADELAAYARQAGGEIDRLFRAGHRAARPFAREHVARLGDAEPHLLIDFRRLLLAPAGMASEDALLLERYADPAEVRRGLEDLAAAGLLRSEDGRWLATDRGREVLLGLTEAIDRGTYQVWGGHGAAVQRALAPASRALSTARRQLVAQDYPAFTAESGGYLPEDAGTSFQLWNRLSSLRYLRADAHAGAWDAAGLDRPRIVCLTHLWHTEEPLTVADLVGGTLLEAPDVLSALGGLEGAGFVGAEGGAWRLTSAGYAYREAIEDETDRRAAPAFAFLAPDERAALLSSLTELPSD